MIMARLFDIDKFVDMLADEGGKLILQAVNYMRILLTLHHIFQMQHNIFLSMVIG